MLNNAVFRYGEVCFGAVISTAAAARRLWVRLQPFCVEFACYPCDMHVDLVDSKLPVSVDGCLLAMNW